LEDAGWEVREKVYHLFGSGFPKSLDVGKAIDKAAGAEREVVGPPTRHTGQSYQWAGTVRHPTHSESKASLTAPATDAARQWDGWGTALKPAAEEWILARKPLVGTVAANVQQWGTGGLNIEACRVGTAESTQRTVGRTAAGRWPSNLVLSHAPGCQRVGTRRVRGGKGGTRKAGTEFGQGSGWNSHENRDSVKVGHADADGLEAVEEWECVEGCAVRALAEQSGVSGGGKMVVGGTPRKTTGHVCTGSPDRSQSLMSYGDTGTAARFFPNFEPSPLDDVTPFLYTAKASRREREAGLEGMEERERTKANMTSRAERENRGKRQDAKARNHHPTVKPLSLMRWLAKLITPPGGVVLDPFLGSGTTGMAAVMEGFGFIGVEQDAEYIEIARRRIAWAQEQQPPLLRATGD
jgi:site-specific DNA-methyltransferase (adenine-specific)